MANFTSIREHADKVKTIDPKNLERESFYYVDISSIDRQRKLVQNPILLKRDDAPSRARQILKTGDVVVSTVRPNLNAVARISKKFDGEIGSTGFCVIRPKPTLDSSYLFHLCRSDTFIDFLVSRANGAGYPAVTDSDVLDVIFPAHPLPDQQAIAQRLERADRLRRLRQHALTISDQYLQNVFLEMFGDPETNPKGWDRAEIAEVVASSQYGTSRKSNTDGRGYPVIGMNHITYSGRIEVSDFNHVELSQADFDDLVLQKGDILFNRTNSTDLVGKTAVWNLDLKAVPASYLIRIKLKDSVTPEFFAALLNTPHFKRTFVDRCKRAVSQSNVSPTLLKEFVMYVPPRSLQDTFTKVVQKHERLRRMQVEALRQAEQLYETLLDEAFGGAK